MSSNGSGNGSGSRSFGRGFVSGVPEGPRAYFTGRHSTVTGTSGPSEPSGGFGRLVWNVGPARTLRFAHAGYHGVLSPTEQQGVDHAAGHAAGSLAGSLATGRVVGQALSRLHSAVPPRFKPVVTVALWANRGLTAATLWNAPQRFNASLEQRAPVVRTGASFAFSALNRLPPSSARAHMDSMTSLFDHSAQQRRTTGASSFRGADDLPRVLAQTHAPWPTRR